MADQDPASPKSKEEIIREIAKTLHDRRRARGLTLEKVNQSIKIRIPYLQAMEQGEWNDLPGDVYIRGFIKRYAQYLGIDGEALMAPYFALTGSPVEKHPADVQPVSKPGGEFSKKHVVWSLSLLVGLVVLFKVLTPRQSMEPVAPPATKETPPVTAPAKPAEQPAKTDDKPLVAERHKVEIYSPLPLWLRVQAQDRGFEGFIPQSSSWSWEGQGQFTIRFGHTQQVALRFDSKPVVLNENQKKITLPADAN